MEKSIIEDQLYSAPQIAKLLHLDNKVIYKMAYSGEIPHVKLTEKSEIRFCGWQVRQWLDQKVSAQ